MCTKIISVICLLVAGNLMAATIYVPADQPTIQDGINFSSHGDTVLVSPGTYVESIHFNGKKIVVLSAGGPDVTTIVSVDLNHAAVYFDAGEPKGAEIAGFTITGGGRGGLYCDGSSPTISGNVITNNRSSSGNEGAGIELNNTSGSMIRHNIVHDNTASTYGPGMHFEGSQDDTVMYNILYANIGYCDIRGLSSSLVILNNTISVTVTVGIQSRLVGQYIIRNNIIFYASEFAISIDSHEGGVQIAEYNCTFANGAGYKTPPGNIGNIYADAGFIDSLNHDYRLVPGSPCIDAGDPNPIYNDRDGSRNDMGAVWAQLSLPLATNINYGPSAFGDTVLTLTPDIFWTFTDTGSTAQAGYEIEVGTDNDWSFAEMWASGAVTSSATQITYGGAALTNRTTYYLRLRLNNGEHWGEWATATFTTHVPSIIHVPGDQPTIQDGVNLAATGDTVEVADGSYYENVIINESIVLKSENGYEQTIIESADQSNPIIRIENHTDSTCRIEGFTLRNSPKKAIVVYAAAATVVDNLISGNEEAGIYCSAASVWISGNRFTGNTSVPSHGGSSVKGVVESNVVISGNLIYRDNGEWVIAVDGGSAIVTNNTIDNCTQGIMAIYTTDRVVENNIITNCSPYGSVSLIYFDGSIDPKPDYNDCWNNLLSQDPGPHGLSADPGYINSNEGNYRLQANSPCIEAGNPNYAVPPGGGHYVDIGAYEYTALCGDVNTDSTANAGDAVHLVNYIFKAGSPPAPIFAGDVNCDDRTDVGDAVYMITYVFKGGSSPCENCE